MKKFILIIVALSTLLTGCVVGAGMGDYTIKLTSSYSIIRNSSQSIDIYSNSKLITENPSSAIITDVAFDDTYIIAKQTGLKSKDTQDPTSKKVLDNSKEYYWIIVTNDEAIYGPLSYEDFLSKKKELSLPDTLELKKIDYYKKIY